MELMEAVNTGDISAEAMRKMAPILKNDIPESLEYIQSSIARMDMQLSACSSFRGLAARPSQWKILI